MSKLRTTARVAIMAAMPMNSHSSWFTAKSGTMRVTNAIPMPDSANEMGRIAGSAAGASRRTAM